MQNIDYEIVVDIKTRGNGEVKRSRGRSSSEIKWKEWSYRQWNQPQIPRWRWYPAAIRRKKGRHRLARDRTRDLCRVTFLRFGLFSRSRRNTAATDVKDVYAKRSDAFEHSVIVSRCINRSLTNFIFSHSNGDPAFQLTYCYAVGSYVHNNDRSTNTFQWYQTKTLIFRFIYNNYNNYLLIQ